MGESRWSRIGCARWWRSSSSGQHTEPCRGDAWRQPGHARQPRCGHLRRVHPPRARGEDQALGQGAQPGGGVLPDRTPRGSSSSTCTGCRSGPTRRSSTPGPGPTTPGRSATLSTSPASPLSRCTSPTSPSARSGGSTRSSTGLDLLIGAGLRQGAGRLSRGAGADREEARRMTQARDAAGRAGRRARTRPALRLGPGQRPLPDRLHRARTAPASWGADERVFFTDFRYTERAQGRGRAGVGAARGRAGADPADRRADVRQGRLRGRQAERPPARPAARRPPATTSSSFRPAIWSSSCGASRSPTSSSASPRRLSSPTGSTSGRCERGLAGRTERDVARALRGAPARARRRALLPADRRRGRERRAPSRRAGRA